MQRLLNDSLVLIATVTEDSSVACKFFANHTARDIWYGSCNSLWRFVQSRDVFQEKGVPLAYSSNRKTNKHLKIFQVFIVFRNYSNAFPRNIRTLLQHHKVFHGKTQTTNLRMPSDRGLVLRFSSLQFTFKRQEGRPAGSDLRQGFLPLKIVQPLRLKARSSFLYPSAMCLLDVWNRINELSLLLEVMHFDSRKNNMSALNNEHLAKIWNPGIVKARTRNCKLQLLRFVFSHEKPNAKGLHQCCHVK